MNKLASKWAYSNFNIATAALCYSLTTYYILEIKVVDVALVVLIFCATLANYIFHRVFPIYLHSYKKHPNKIFQWSIDHLHFLSISFFVAFVLLIFTFFKIKVQTQFCLIVLAIITLLYSTPIIKSTKIRKRLRDVAYIKILLIAFTWALVCGSLPLIQSSEQFMLSQHVAVFFEKFFYIIAITIPFDIRDMEHDKSTDVKTIPIKIGIGNSILFALFCLVVSYVILLSVSNNISLQIAYLFTYAVTAYYILESSIKIDNFFYLFYMDGLMILLFFLVVLFATIF